MTLKNNNSNDYSNKVDLFLLKIEDYQEDFIKIYQSKGYNLDYSLESLQTLEKLIINEQISLEEDKTDARWDCWIYLGEVVCKNFNGYRKISNSNENSINKGMFIITGHTKRDIEYVPSRAIKAFILKKKYGFLLSSIMSQISFNRLDLKPE